MAYTLAPAIMLSVSLGLAPHAAPTADAAGKPAPGAEPSTLDIVPRLANVVGRDGRPRHPAPAVVEGRGGEEFLGLELDYACAYGDSTFDRRMRRLGRLADLIAASGREVVLTIAPGKTLLLDERLKKRDLPHGRCALSGIRHQQEVLDTFDNPHYLPLRRALDRQPGQTYWKQDGHWTTAGGAVFARRLADRMGPRLGDLQTYEPTEESMVGMFSSLLGLDRVETAPGLRPTDGRVEVTTAPGSLNWVGYPYLVFRHAWTTTPAEQTRSGSTLVLGDSFSLLDLTNLRPIFRSGQFLWVGHVSEEEMISAVVASHTVVIEQYHMAVPDSLLGRIGFQRRLRAALG